MTPSTDFDLKALYIALDMQRQSGGLTWQQAMREINRGWDHSPAIRPIARSTVASLRSKTIAEGDGILQMLRWLQRTPESFVPGCAASDSQRLPEVPAHRLLRFDTGRLYAALDAQRTIGGLTWQKVADDLAGMSVTSLRHLKKGGRTAFPLVTRMASWLNQPVAHFTRVSDW